MPQKAFEIFFIVKKRATITFAFPRAFEDILFQTINN